MESKEVVYLVSIAKIETVTMKERGSYQIVEKTPLRESDLKGSVYINRDEEIKKGIVLVERWGYPPARDIEEEVKREVFSQRIEARSDFDLRRIIAAINNLETGETVLRG